MNILAADIGGTSSRFSWFTCEKDGELRQTETTWLKTSDVSSFEELLTKLSAQAPNLRPSNFDYCVFAVAGPVEGGRRCNPPNIPWEIDLQHDSAEFGLNRFALINDFLAQAFACISPVSKEAEAIHSGTPQLDAPIAVVGAGTGLGKAALLSARNGFRVGMSSEGGHTNFAAETREEFEFQTFMTKKLGVEYLVWDEVVSGKGLSAIHEFLSGEKLEPAEVARGFNTESLTLEWAARMYGRVTRNFVLETVALGGLYIAGGVAAKNPVLISHPEFLRSFRSSAKHAQLLAKIPVSLLDNQESGLWGAAYYGLQELKEG